MNELDGIMLSEIKSEGKTSTLWFHLNVESKKQMNKQHKKLTDTERTDGCQKWGRWGDRQKGELRSTNCQL